jgi:D-alanyl-D-alanine endopeptidase (penicillin-binding protein 7)
MRLPLVVMLGLGTFAVALPRDAHARGHARAHERATPALTRDGLPNVKADSAIIVDLDTGEELFAKNADAVRPIASVGKLFLALAVRAKGLPLEGTTTIVADDKEFASGGARSRLPVGRTFNNHDLLRAMLIASDNRACTAVGRGAGLDPKGLVAAMNDVARGLGLHHTSFTDPTGLRGNVSTARELTTVLKAALADPVVADVLATPEAVVRSVDAKSPVSVEYRSTDVALRTEKRFPVLGGKTGYTDDAKYCLAIAARPGGRRVGMVFLGEEGKLTRFADFNRAAAWLLARDDSHGAGAVHAAP